MPIKIYFRYLFLRLLAPFAVCLGACTLIWVMADFYGNVDDFLGHGVGLGKILYFYSLQIPTLLVQVLPATILISTLVTLISLNRRCELVALQAGGMAPFVLYLPFVIFTLFWVAVLAFDLNWPAPRSQVARERVLLQVKGQDAKNNVLTNLPYVDTVRNHVWFFQKLDSNQNTAKGIELLERNADGHDLVKFFAQEGKWNGEFWEFTHVLKITFGLDGKIDKQQTFDSLALPEVTTPPRQLSLIVAQPEQLTVSQLSQYIATSTAPEENLARYRTEWWHRVLYPFSLLVLMMFGLLHGARTDRRNALSGVMVAIVVLLFFIAFNQLFLAFGAHNRLPPFVAVVATPLIFGLIGLHLLAVGNGWWWQLLD